MTLLQSSQGRHLGLLGSAVSARLLHQAIGSVALLALLVIAQPAFPKPRALTGIWEVSEGEFAGRQTCIAIGEAGQSTTLLLKLDADLALNHQVALLFLDMSWSIREGDSLGVMRFYAGSETLSAKPVADEHGFFFYAPLETLEHWFAEAKSSGFWIEFEDKKLGPYRGGNLPTAFRKLRSCGEKLARSDPFAG